MRQNLTLLGFLFLFLAYLVVTDKRDELQMQWDTRIDHTNLSDFMHDDGIDIAQEKIDYPDTLSI